MFTFASRLLPAMALAVVLPIESSPAQTELPHHALVQLLTPLPDEAYWPDDHPRDNLFGTSVVFRDGLAFIGMPAAMTTGQVAVFTQGTQGWMRTATIRASDRTTDDRFGQALSFRDGLLVVGSTRAAYVYKRVNGVWRERQKIVSPAADLVDRFGDLEHQSGVLAINAFTFGFENIGLSDSVYVFEQDANGRFVRRARLAPSTGSRAGFGTSISMTKAIIVIGSYAGTAYVFGRDSSGTWVQRQQLIATSRTNPFDGYGRTVAVDNGMILVGAPESTFEHDTTGDVYVFLPGATRYVEAFKLPRLLENHRFGSSLAISDRYIAVGAMEPTSLEDVPPGYVVTYSREGSTVRLLGIISGNDTGGHFKAARLPESIDIADNLLLFGSPLDKTCGAYEDYCVPIGVDIGQAYVFRLNQFKPK